MKEMDSTNNNILDKRVQLSELFLKEIRSSERKKKGQFFTPIQIGRFMAKLFNIKKNRIELLDPGGGTGILSCTFCESLLKIRKKIFLTIDIFENDSSLITYLEKKLDHLKIEFEKQGHHLSFNIYNKDFILQNNYYFNKDQLFKKTLKLYDFVIANPPYFKLNKNSPQSQVMADLVYGQPNIYALFMALSACMLKKGGELVFITPRSFCSGLYYKKFREWFLDNMVITNIHIFDSRKDIFDKDKVLQENIILKAKKEVRQDHQYSEIEISRSKDKSFNKIEKMSFRYDEIIHYKNGDIIIRIPTSKEDNRILNTLDALPSTLNSLGFEISTGPVVHFKAKDYIISELKDREKEAPLFWMHNIQGMRIIWPLDKNGKEKAIKICQETNSILLPTKNYVLLKRFSSKEQTRRLYAGILLRSDINYKMIGLENHLNYIHKPKGEISINEAYGIAAILNSSIMDNFFRSLSGNTQVNATDIRKLPLPSIKKIKEIGSLVKNVKPEIGDELDNIISKKLIITDKTTKKIQGEQKYVEN